MNVNEQIVIEQKDIDALSGASFWAWQYWNDKAAEQLEAGNTREAESAMRLAEKFYAVGMPARRWKAAQAAA